MTRIMQVHWNEHQLNTFVWLMCAIGTVSWCLCYLAWEIEYKSLSYALAFIGLFFFGVQGLSGDLKENNTGATVTIDDDMFKCRKPSTGFYIEFLLNDIERVFIVNWWFFSFIRLSMKNKKCFTLYFYDVEKLKSELINLKVITTTDS